MNQDLIIPAERLRGVNLSPEELTLELAVWLYAQKQLTMGQAKRLAGLDQISFQRALATRDVYIHYDLADLEVDVRNLGLMGEI